MSNKEIIVLGERMILGEELDNEIEENEKYYNRSCYFLGFLPFK